MIISFVYFVTGRRKRNSSATFFPEGPEIQRIQSQPSVSGQQKSGGDRPNFGKKRSEHGGGNDNL